MSEHINKRYNNYDKNNIPVSTFELPIVSEIEEYPNFLYNGENSYNINNIDITTTLKNIIIEQNKIIEENKTVINNLTEKNKELESKSIPTNNCTKLLDEINNKYQNHIIRLDREVHKINDSYNKLLKDFTT